jgi:hypothetical protein
MRGKKKGSQVEQKGEEYGALLELGTSFSLSMGLHVAGGSYVLLPQHQTSTTRRYQQRQRKLHL